MINRVKQGVKGFLTERKIAEYDAWMDELYVSYHEWIGQKEQAYRDSIKPVKTSLCAVVVDADNVAEVSVQNSVCGNTGYEEADIWIFTIKPDGDTTCQDGSAGNFLSEDLKMIVEDYFANNPECILAYGDEDEWNHSRTVRMNPWFKPDFSPDTLLEYCYYGNVIAIRKSACDLLFAKKGDGKWSSHAVCEWQSLQDRVEREKWLYRLCLDVSFPAEDKRKRIGHIPYVLYHTPCRRQYGMERIFDSIKESCVRSMQDENKTDGRVSVIIPSKDHPEVLETCLRSLQMTQQDAGYEILVVDNGSREENKKEYEKLKIKYRFNYIYQPMEFHFSRMCNLGAECANGQFLLFLNDDIEAIANGWMEKMKQVASRPHVGCVGAKLYYPDSKMIQHAGITNLRLGPVHKLQFLEDVRLYYDGRNRIDHNVIAVTGACMMIRRDVWDLCGGFSEDLAVAFNDVELCFRIYKKGYYPVVCNSVALYHHESLSRGNDESEEKQSRLQKERNTMYAMHPDLYGWDPFYHPYLNTLILDTYFSSAYEYPAGSDVAVETPQLMKEAIRDEWYNECLLISLEYAGDLHGWMNGPQGDEDAKENILEDTEANGNADAQNGYLYFQGYQFVIGSQNPAFERFLLCKHVESGRVYQIPCVYTFRPDLDRNVKEGHTSLCGFSLVVKKTDMEPGRYRLGGMAKSSISRQVLCRFTNKFLEIGNYETT